MINECLSCLCLLLPIFRFVSDPPHTKNLKGILSYPPLSTMWAAINEDNFECTLFEEERDALLYVCLLLLSYRYTFPIHPRKMDTAALSAYVGDQMGDDKSWFVTETSMGKVDEVKEEDEGDE